MAEGLGTRDVLEQVDTRLITVEQDIKALRCEMQDSSERQSSEMNAGFDKHDARFEDLGARMNAGFEQQMRWPVGLIFASWLSIMASFWLKS